MYVCYPPTITLGPLPPPPLESHLNIERVGFSCKFSIKQIGSTVVVNPIGSESLFGLINILCC